MITLTFNVNPTTKFVSGKIVVDTNSINHFNYYNHEDYINACCDKYHAKKNKIGHNIEFEVIGNRNTRYNQVRSYALYDTLNSVLW